MRVQIQTVESEPFGQNAFVVWATHSSEAVVVDPGFEPEVILEFLAKQRLTLAAILNTHGHVDHIAGNRAMKEAFPAAPLIIGRGDAAMLADAMSNLSGAYGIPVISPPHDRLVDDGEVLSVAGLDFNVWEIPGHSPGHVVFHLAAANPPILFGGDVLFSGSIGRTDFPGGSLKQLLSGIRTKLWPLPAETIVYPGHGPTTTIGEEMRTNPYVNG